MIYVRPWQSYFGDGTTNPSDDNNSAEFNMNQATDVDSVLNHILNGKVSDFNNIAGLVGDPTVVPPVISSGSSSGNVLENDETGAPDSPTTYGFLDFLKGLFASQGAENAINRQYNSAEAQANREFQAKESQLQREWYTDMSNSAYQRAVADMKAAGINPILAYQQGGAATATTGIATGSAASYGATGGDTISSLINGIANLIGAVGNASSKKFDAAMSILKFLV